MIFSYNWIQSYFKKRLPKPEKLAELLTMHSFEVEDLKKIGKDFVLNIDVLPNRGPDCFSHIGIAREIGAVLNYKFQAPNFKLKENKDLKTKDFITAEVKDKKACFRYTVRVATDVTVSSSPKWIQQRIEACGLKPINNIVDIVNYVMLETGQPMHAFDLEKLENINQEIKTKKIIVRFSGERERIVTLDEENYDLNDDILVIADEKKPIAIAGIKGGKIPEIDKNTKIVAIEAANFNLHNIRKASKKLNLKTDASWRFEHGIDPNLTGEAINRAAFLIKEIAGGNIALGLENIYPKKVFPKKIKLDLNYVKKLLGMEISQKEIVKILKSLEFKVSQSSSSLSQLIVEIPTFRQDASIQEDLIEEIGRIYGYEKIKSKSLILPIAPVKNNIDLLWEKKIKEIAKGLGFVETYNYSFISDEDREFLEGNIGDNQRKQDSALVKIKNPVSSNVKYLRPSLLPNLLKTVKNNYKRFGEIELFEVGKIYWRKTKNEKRKTKNASQNLKVSEKKMLAGIILGKDKFYELKGSVDALFDGLGAADVVFDSFHPKSEKFSVFWQKRKTAEIRERQGNVKIGFLGEISNEACKFYQIEKPVFAFEIDFSELLNLVEGEHEYEAPSPYPEVIRDLAILVPIKTLADEVIQKIHIAGGKIICNVEIFDIFQGPPLPEGKKNFAFRIIYQSKNKNLISKEINKIQEKIIKALEKNIDWQVRK